MNVNDIINQDETMRMVVRRHWINQAPMIAALLIISVIALFGIYVLGRYGAPGQTGVVGPALIGLVAMLVLGLLLAYGSLRVYRENRLIITTQNIYLVTKTSLLNQTVSQFSLDRLQDVSVSQQGLLANILDFGDLTIETAGEEDNFVFRQAPRPRQLAHIIMTYHDEAKQGTPATAGDV